jgi:hypothetical protein
MPVPLPVVIIFSPKKLVVVNVETTDTTEGFTCSTTSAISGNSRIEIVEGCLKSGVGVGARRGVLIGVVVTHARVTTTNNIDRQKAINFTQKLFITSGRGSNMLKIC